MPIKGVRREILQAARQRAPEINLRRQRQHLLSLFGTVAALSLGTDCLAGGFESPVESVRGVGSAGSGEVTGQGVDYLWRNPAAISDIEGTEVFIGVSAVLADATVTDQSSTITRPFTPVLPVGGDPSVDPVGANASPALGVAWRLAPGVTAGVTLNAPFGFDLASPDTAWSRFQGTTVLLITADAQAGLAWRLNDRLSVGAGVDLIYSKLRMDSALPNLSMLEPDGASSFRGDGWNIGWVVGAQWRPLDALTIGASYRAGVTRGLDGQLETQGLSGPLALGNGVSDASARFSTPWSAALGMRWQVTSRLALTIQATRTGWSRFETIEVERPGGSTSPATPGRDTTAISVGAEFAWSPRLTLRAGWQADPQAIAGSAMLTDGDRRLYAAGASYRLNERASVDFAVGYLDFKTSPIDADATAYAGTQLAMPVRLSGQVAAQAGLVSVGLRKAF